MSFLNRWNYKYFLPPMIRRKERFVKLWRHQPIRGITRKVLELDTGRLLLIPSTEREIETGGGTAIPYSIVEHFVREASHRVILSHCPCRDALDCKDFDPGFGCTFLGEGAREIDSAIGRHVGLKEALEHVREANRLGLVSAIGRFRADALALGVRRHEKLMTICHCCPCCCLTTTLKDAPREGMDFVSRLEGSEVRVSGDCTGCGSCEDACIFDQVRVSDGRAVVSDDCKGCGRCVAACPEGALTFEVDPAILDSAVSFISSRVDVT